MRKAILGLLLTLSTVAWAQMDGPGCSSACYTVTDNTCSENGNCNNWASAQTLTFTAGCTGTFNFICKTDCENCYGCGSCARLIKVSTGIVIGNCRSTLDGNQMCEWPCDNDSYDNPNPQLLSGAQYRLEVMLQRCPLADSCTQCNSCIARARVYHSDATCTAW